MNETFDDVACTVCGCVCDDLRITTDGKRIVSAERACELAKPWFAAQRSDLPRAAEINGRSTSLDAALDHAAELLRQAKSPLIYGLSRSTTEGQRAAVALAERIGATIDTTAATGHAQSLMALQQVGESTCTLGEIKNRADLVIYWGSDPLTTHPRHLERYSVEPRGFAIPNGRQDRTLIVADAQPTITSSVADEFIAIRPGEDWEAFWALRAMVRGQSLPSDANVGADRQQLERLAERMKSAKCGVIFFGVALTRGGLGHRTVAAMLELVNDLNRFTRFYARRMRRLGDVAGADSVLTWQTGYPFGVNFAAGYPRYNPGEFSAPEMLARGEIDACLFVGSETALEFPVEAQARLRQIPIITLDSPGVKPFIPPTVRFTTAVYGVHRPGTAYRMDEVPIPLRVLLPTSLPSDGEILTALRDRLPFSTIQAS
ncbi:formylmethanofuran dehydrogenase subunit B [Tuwongella immobilis]|uniref:Molybdopterin oxidoreductase domain-containing protein n=1 Tax=Tuwongella immobilis TaxID=692036 RepID=A0A6C2YND6_9BACT|nr:formylmethanofuran dehydrogenase subunit B [Tuwongella immobilis]VIP02887.1 formylmethanofuran dehydrogenase subunit b : Formyltransferase/hydrolase complex subunit B OS=uncultured bacterium BAC10-4 GN=fhcB PE=4 SV=2: Molybdopterin [Tuwongella immobilis]VTS02749.1 formylmethanofuran dehydrogenase subunit b : Formyltransferase/hydrolase complex subunit B OS=uncultured bacterium BAC10-4 GN=fhcB PE=4 SV=2: Molybdopterin [Tuwongella immobilis]